MRQDMIFRHCGILLLLGISLVGLVFFAPNTAENPTADSFFNVAASSTWTKLMDMDAAWCSLKIILLSLGVFLVIESVGTILSVLKREKLAWTIYSLHLVSCLGMLLGGYYFAKALL